MTMAQPRHPLVGLATDAIRIFLLEQRVLEPPGSLFAEIPTASDPAGAFVSLKLESRLRGCIGTTEAARKTLAEEIIHNAIGAATRDPRFPAVTPSELETLVVSVDVLNRPEPVRDLQELDHRRYGVIVRSGTRHGVLLPDIEGIDSIAEQLTAAKKKVGLFEHDPADLFRFEVIRYV